MKDHNPSPITRQATGVAAKSQLDGELADLLARVEAATGPDRELEKALWYKLIFDPALDRKDDSYLKLVGTGFPRYTASLDAALALTERVLPGWGVRVERWPNGLSNALAWREIGWSFTANAETPALALIAATLKALSHQPPRAPDEPGDRAREETKS